MRPSTRGPISPRCTAAIGSMKCGSARLWWPTWTTCLLSARGLHHGVEVGPAEAHRLLAVEVLSGRDRVEIAPGVQVARDGGDDGVEAVRPEHFPPGTVGAELRPLPSGPPRRPSRRPPGAGVDVADGTHLDAGICRRFLSSTEPRLPTPINPTPSVSLGPTASKGEVARAPAAAPRNVRLGRLVIAILPTGTPSNRGYARRDAPPNARPAAQSNRSIATPQGGGRRRSRAVSGLAGPFSEGPRRTQPPDELIWIWRYSIWPRSPSRPMGPVSGSLSWASRTSPLQVHRPRPP